MKNKKNLRGFSDYKNMANFEAFLQGITRSTVGVSAVRPSETKLLKALVMATEATQDIQIGSATLGYDHVNGPSPFC